MTVKEVLALFCNLSCLDHGFLDDEDSATPDLA